MIFLILLLAVFLTYNLYVYRKCGILKSISASYYKVHPVIFTAFIASVSVLMVLATQKPIMFCAGGLLGLVAMAPAFLRDDMERVHIFGAISGITLGFASIAFEFHIWEIPILMVIFTGMFMLYNASNKTYWNEVTAFLLIFVGVLISKI